MSTHYLVDLFAPVLDNAAIIDVRDPSNLQTISNGALVVRVPDGVRIQRPANYADLRDQKYMGLLGFYAGFTRVKFDDFPDTSLVNVAASSQLLLGSRASISLFPSGILQSVLVALTGGVPTQAILLWETAQISATDDKNDRYQRVYEEVASGGSTISCDVSFNGGSTFNAVTDGAVLNIPIPDQGTDLVVRFTNVSTDKLLLGSWTLIY